MRKVFFDRFVVYTACHRQTHARCQTKFYGELSNQVQHFLQFLFKQICRCFVTEYFFRSTSASSRRSRGSIRKHLAVPYRRSLFRPRFARPYGSKRSKKQGVRHKCHSLFLWLAPLPRSPLRSADGHRNRDAIVPRYLHISASPIGNRYSVADSVRSLQLPSAPPTLRADARAARYDSISPYPIGNRYSVADSVRSLQLPSAPPTLRADARAARYESISPYPIGARYSVLASLVLTAQKVVDCIKKKPVKADFFCLSVIARCRRARRT